MIAARTPGGLHLLAVAVLMLLPGLAALPVTDRDDARFVQSGRQMVASGNPVVIRFHDEARHKKPVGIYWAQSLAALASGQGPKRRFGCSACPR
ncbi:MAG: hypothetical protein Q4G49_09880 [Paracoccus sp. (in: a-proteobacteria)]|nr:hypothetical protein [Paracoccus sp. (in: a-proteobacteria)]